MRRVDVKQTFELKREIEEILKFLMNKLFYKGHNVVFYSHKLYCLINCSPFNYSGFIFVMFDTISLITGLD